MFESCRALQTSLRQHCRSALGVDDGDLLSASATLKRAQWAILVDRLPHMYPLSSLVIFTVVLRDLAGDPLLTDC
jgi:hypothetical protein